MIMQRLDALATHFAARRYWRWLGTPLLVAPGLAGANPTGADVIAGDVTITNTDANTLTLDQVTDTAAINWQSFSVGANEYVVFNQPSASSLALNRVVGGIPSEIFGHLLSNGRVFLINPSGVLFGQGATIDVGALMVSTANLSDEDFAAGRYVFTNAGEGSIVNAGNIIAGPNGFVVLAADSVSNTGLIQASLGQVVLASGNAFTLDLVGDGLINFTIDAAALSARSGVENLGQVVADGGKVVMAARTAAELARTVVNNSGLVQARSIADGENGEIILTAAGGDIVNSGTLDAAGVDGQGGGTIELVGDRAVRLASTSVIRASGDGGAQGGSVHISGHTVAIRGVLDVGQGGRFALDPAVLEIRNGAGGSSNVFGSTGTGFIYEQTIESLLRGGADVILTATDRITLLDLADGALDGVDTAGGVSDDGSLLLGIGVDTNGAAPGGFVRGPGVPLGGIEFSDANDAIIVGRRLQLVGGSANGGVTVGNLTAGDDISIQAVEGITAGTLTAGGRAFVQNTGAGDVALGDVAAGDSFSAFVQNGNLDLDDVTVTRSGDGSEALVSLTALGSGANAGNIIADELTDTISISHASYAARIDADASGDLRINRLVMQGGGGSSSAFSSPGAMVTATLSAGTGTDDDLVVRSGSLTTERFLFNATDTSADSFSSHADAYASLTAGGDITIGTAGAGGTFNVAGYGDVTLSIFAGDDVALNNVAISAAAAMTSRIVSGSTAGSTGSVSFRSGSFDSSYASRGNARLVVDAGGDIAVPATGAIKLRGAGSADASLDATGAIVIGGSITVEATRGASYDFSSAFASSFSISGSTLGRTRSFSRSSESSGRAGLFVRASGPLSVSGTVDVEGYGDAEARFVSSSDDVTVSSPITVTAFAGLSTSSSASSYGPGLSFQGSERQSAASSGSATLDIRADNFAGSVTIDAPLTVSAPGDASVKIMGASVTVTGSASLAVTADRGHDEAYHFDRNEFGEGSGFSSFVSADSNSRGDALVLIAASDGALRVDGAITVDANGDAGVTLYANSNSSAALVVAAPVTITNGGSSGYAHFESSSSSSSSGTIQRQYSNDEAWGQRGRSRLNLIAQGAYGDVVIEAGGTLDVQAYGDASVYFQADRDVAIGGAITVTAHRAYSAYGSVDASTHDYGSYYRDSLQAREEAGYAGSAAVSFGSIGNNLTINAPITVSGNGEADVQNNGSIGGNVRINAPITVSDAGSLYHSNSTYSSAFVPDSGAATGYFSFSSTGGASGSYALQGSADVRFVRVNGSIEITANGAIDASGVGDVDVVLATQLGGDIDIGGDITVAATAGDYRYFSSSQSDRSTSSYDYRYSSSSARGSASLVVVADGDLDAHAGAAISVTGDGNANVLLRSGGSVTLTGPVVLAGNAGAYHSESSWRYDSASDGFTYHSDSQSDRTSAGGNANVQVQAGRDIVIGAGGITMTAHGDAGLSLLTGFGGSYGDIQLNGPIQLSNSGPATFSFDERYHQSSAGSGSYRYTYDSASDGRFSGGGVQVSIQATAAGAYGGRVTGNAAGAIDLDGLGAASLDIIAPNGVDLAGPITVASTAYDSSEHYTSGSYGTNSAGTLGFSRTYSSSSQFTGGSANVDIQSARGSVHIGGAVTVTAAGNADLDVSANSSFASPARSLEIVGPVQVISTANQYSYTSSGQSSSFNVAGGVRGTTISSTSGSYLQASSFGLAFVDLFDGYGGITLGNVDVTGVGSVGVSIDGTTANVGNVTVTANDGDAFLGAAGDASVFIEGSFGNPGGVETFGARAGSVTVTGRDVFVGGTAAMDLLQIDAIETIYGSGGTPSYGSGGFGGLFAEAVGMTAGSSINLTSLRLGIGGGAAPFGADEIADFLIDNAVPGLVGEINPNGAFSAASVTFGGLNLTGTAIYIRTDNVTYNAAIEYDVATPPASGYIVRYETFTFGAPIQIVDAAPAPLALEVVAPTELALGTVYYDASDFAYPGTTYIIGGSQALNDVIVGDGVMLPPAGSGADDNFIFMTGGTVEFVDEIPTSGQVVVINPFLASGPDDFFPYYVDWKMTAIGDDGEMEEDSLEHEEQPQAGEAPEGEEGQIDQKTGGALECK